MSAAEWHAERYRVLSTTAGDVDTPDHSDACTDQACTSCATLWRAS